MMEYIAAGVLALTGLSVAGRVVWPLVAPKAKGFIGESRVGRILSKFRSEGAAVLHNLLLPGGRDTTQIDFVLITRHAAFVIEVKNYRGSIRGNPTRDQWEHVLPGGRTFPFYNPLQQNEVHVDAVRKLLRKYPNLPIHSLVVFNNSCKIPAVPNLVKMPYLTLGIQSRCPGDPILSPEDVRDIEATLRANSISGREARKQHDAKAFLAAEAAKHRDEYNMSKLQARAKDTPLLDFGERPAKPTRSAELNKLTDAGATLNIHGKRGSIEEIFESSKRDKNGAPVPHGADFDHFVCPYTGDTFPASEAKNLYQGLWIAYLRRNPELVEYLKENPSAHPGDSFRCHKVISSYLQDSDSFISQARATDWYRNMERKQAVRKKQVFQDKGSRTAHSTLSRQISDAEQRKPSQVRHKETSKSYTRS